MICFAGACGTAKFTTEAPYEPYTDINGDEHIGTDNGEIFVDVPPQPACLQITNNPGCLMEQFLVETPIGAIAYIGCVTGAQPFCRDLDFYFYEGYSPECYLGEMYNYMINQYYIKYPVPDSIPSPDWTVVAMVHQPWKFPLFGDPSLRVGGVEFIDNSPPDLPLINGPSTGTRLGSYEYTFKSVDPESDAIYYYINWGDDSGTIRLGPYASGEEITIAHMWITNAAYTITVFAEDIHCARSNVSHKTVTISDITIGDANRDGIINISDAVYIINFIFIPGSPTPVPLCRADTNGDGVINVSDAVMIINYVLINGPPPINTACADPW